MKTNFTARKFEASKDLQNFVLEEVGKLTKFYDGILSCDILLEPTPDNEEPAKAELTVKVKRDLLNASESGAAYEQATRSAVDSIRRQLIKYKNKRSSSRN